MDFIATPDALRQLAQQLEQKQSGSLACACARLGPCTSWESVSEDRWPAADMLAVGTLRDPELGEPTFEEFHQGTRYDSSDAPVALRYFPYNRCDVWQCKSCARLWLRYTEFGGYYVDHRVRALNPALIVDAPSPA